MMKNQKPVTPGPAQAPAAGRDSGARPWRTKLLLVLPLLPLLFTALAGLSAAPALAAPFEDSIAQRTMACTACHGPQGRAAPDGYYPRLAGKPVGYLYNQLLNFRDGRRHYGLMTQLLDPLTDEYLLEIAQYFSALDVPYPAPLAGGSAGLVRRGQQLVMQGNPSQQLPACVQCHGQAMTGVVPNIPGLLGLPRDYLNAQLGAWRDGQRRAHAPDCMADVVRRLSPDDINAIGTWLAAQPLPANTHPAATLPVPTANYVNLPCGSAPLAGQARTTAPSSSPASSAATNRGASR
ncbi:MAG: c-type cytochrome [Polaromonas sp.]|nr:c-type cytochrome [Polaromonas sp.]